MKRVLCAVDLTHLDDARALVVQAHRLSSSQDAALSVVTVLPDYGTSWVGSFFKDGTLKEAAQAAMLALRELVDAAVASAMEVQCIVEIGTVYEEILDAAAKCHADCIVVGANRPSLSDHIIGPNAARVARNAPVSVMVCRLT